VVSFAVGLIFKFGCKSWWTPKCKVLALSSWRKFKVNVAALLLLLASTPHLIHRDSSVWKIGASLSKASDKELGKSALTHSEPDSASRDRARVPGISWSLSSRPDGYNSKQSLSFPPFSVLHRGITLNGSRTILPIHRPQDTARFVSTSYGKKIRRLKL
jgi:hypothetical protein